MKAKKEVLTINVGDNENSKYWLSVLNELKNRGVKDILIICADGLSGIKEAIATDLKTIYHAATEEKAREALNRVNEKWTQTIRNWGSAYGELCIMYDERLPE